MKSLQVCMAAIQEEVDQRKKLTPRNSMTSLELINKQLLTRLKSHIERRLSKNIPIKVVIQINSRRFNMPMMFSVIKTRESFTIDMVRKDSSKAVEWVVEVMVISSHRCSEEEAVVVVKLDHRKVRAFNTPSRSPLKRSIRVSQPKLLSTETDVAKLVMVREAKTVLTQLALDAREEE